MEKIEKVSTKRDKSGTTFEYLCGGYKYSGICKRRVISATKLEDFVLGQLRNLVNNPIMRDKIVFDRSVKVDENLKDDHSRASNQLSQIPNKLQRQQEAYEAGLITLEEYGVAVKRLRDDESKYRAVTGDYEIKLQQFSERKEELEKFMISIEDFDTLWANAEFQERKHFLRTILKEVRAGNGKIEIDFRF